MLDGWTIVHPHSSLPIKYLLSMKSRDETLDDFSSEKPKTHFLGPFCVFRRKAEKWVILPKIGHFGQKIHITSLFLEIMIFCELYRINMWKSR